MSPKGFRLTESDLLPLSLGAALFGTGGGGNPYIGMLRLRELLRKGASRGYAARGGRRRRLRRFGRRHWRAGRRDRENQAGPGMPARAARRRGSGRGQRVRADLGRDRGLELDRACAHRCLRRPARSRRRWHGARLSRSADVDLLHLRARSVPRRDRRRQGQCRRVQDSRRHVLAGAFRPPHRCRHGGGRGLRDDADVGVLRQEGRRPRAL